MTHDNRTSAIVENGKYEIVAVDGEVHIERYGQMWKSADEIARTGLGKMLIAIAAEIEGLSSTVSYLEYIHE